MSAVEIIAEAERAGITLTAAGGGIRAEPKTALSQALRAQIIAEKPAILAALRERETTARHWRFRLTYPDGRREEVRTLPAATPAEACLLWPGATVEELRDRDPAPPDGRPQADLLALVERVGIACQAPAAEVAEMKRLALADPAAAWSAFLAEAATGAAQ